MVWYNTIHPGEGREGGLVFVAESAGKGRGELSGRAERERSKKKPPGFVAEVRGGYFLQYISGFFIFFTQRGLYSTWIWEEGGVFFCEEQPGGGGGSPLSGEWEAYWFGIRRFVFVAREGGRGGRGCGRPVEKIGRIELMHVRTIIYNKIETLGGGVKVPGY